MSGIPEIASAAKTLVDIFRTIFASVRDGRTRPKTSDIEALASLRGAILELSRATNQLLAIEAKHRTIDRTEWTLWKTNVIDVIAKAHALPFHPLAAAEPGFVNRMGAVFVDDFEAAPRQVQDALLRFLSPSGRATESLRGQLSQLAHKWNLILPAYSTEHDHENALRHLSTMLDGAVDEIDVIVKKYWKPSQ